MMKCEFCDSVIPYNVSQCPSCGAPCKFIPAPEKEDKEENRSSDSDSHSAPKQHVVSMEDVAVPVPPQSSRPKGFLDDLESELNGVEQTTKEDQKNKAVGCTVLSIILIVVVFILWKCCS